MRSRPLSLLAATASVLFIAACADGRSAPDVAAPTVDAGPTASALGDPSILALTPDWGPASGGTVVTVQGEFGMGASVLFKGAFVPTTSISATSAVFVTTPGNRGWHVPVQVVTADGKSTAARYFTYEGTSPLVMFPDYGPTVGATRITLQGENFQQGATVMFNGTALPTTWLSANSLVVLGPAGEGRVKVYVADSGATRDTLSFTYQAPGVSGFSPQSGSVAGGTLLTIVGANFGFSPTVTIGGQVARLERSGHTEILAWTPAASVGPAPLVVTTAGQSSQPVSYTYVQYPPAILGLAPTHGPAAGGNSVTITGADFGTNPSVAFGGRAATLTSISNTQLVAVAPAGQGSVPVTVAHAGGISNPVPYTYDAGVPQVAGIAPANGPTAGGIPVTITGTNLGSGAAVTFGSAVATAISATLTQLVVASPAGEGTVPVVVRTNGGSSAPVNFSYDAPAIASITPSSGSAAGGVPITIAGTNFGVAPVVTFDGVAVPTTVRSHTAIVLSAPAGEPGHTAQVRVTVAGRESNARGFTYDPPRLTGIMPAHGTTAGGTTVTLMGSGFGSAPAVRFGDVEGRVVTPSQSMIVVLAPAGQGTVPVVVRSGTATSNALAYDYDAPSIAAITPASGPAAGGTRITITGSSFGTSGVVTVGGAQASPVSWTHGQVVATTPAGTGGSDAPVVVTVAGKVSNAATFHYECPAGTVAEGSACVTPIEHLGHLVDQLPPDARQGIGALVSQAADKLADGNPANDAAACGQLGAALNQVNALEKRGKVTAAQAAALRAAIALVQEGAGCR